MRGSWLGLQAHHAQKHLHRSILESVAFEYAYFLLVVREMFHQTRFDEIHGIGGGARSRLWSQIKADVLGVPYVMPTREDHTLLGTAAVAAAGVNLVPSIPETIDRWVTAGIRLLPNREHHQNYAELFRVYVRALSELRPLFADLRNLSRRLSSPTPAQAGSQ